MLLQPQPEETTTVSRQPRLVLPKSNYSWKCDIEFANTTLHVVKTTRQLQEYIDFHRDNQALKCLVAVTRPVHATVTRRFWRNEEGILVMQVVAQ